MVVKRGEARRERVDGLLRRLKQPDKGDIQRDLRFVIRVLQRFRQMFCREALKAVQGLKEGAEYRIDN